MRAWLLFMAALCILLTAGGGAFVFGAWLHDTLWGWSDDRAFAANMFAFGFGMLGAAIVWIPVTKLIEKSAEAF